MGIVTIPTLDPTDGADLSDVMDHLASRIEFLAYLWGISRPAQELLLMVQKSGDHQLIW